MTQTTIAIRTTIVLEFVTALVLRCVARKDMPEYGLTEGQCFYCVYSDSESIEAGKRVYHILVWDYANMRWNCPCKCGAKHEHRVACKHTKAVAKDCAKSHKIYSYKPATKAAKFEALKARYDVRNQPCKAEQEAEAIIASNLDPEWAAQEIAECTAAVRSMKRNEAALYTNIVKMEQAPSGRMVPMR